MKDNSSSNGAADPIAILISSAIRSPISKLYVFFKWLAMVMWADVHFRLPKWHFHLQIYKDFFIQDFFWGFFTLLKVFIRWYDLCEIIIYLKITPKFANFILFSYLRKKYNQNAFGDYFVSKRYPDESRLVAVLSDGLGSGIKANILSCMTANDRYARRFRASCRATCSVSLLKYW